MTGPVEVAAVAVALHVATNLDDLFLLIALFSDRRLAPAHIVAGQYLGIGVLYAAGVAASLAALVLPEAVVGLLGLVPVALGLVKLREEIHGSDDEGDDPVPARSGIVAVTAITIASGGDNVAVYTPVFAVQTLAETLLVGLVFAVMIALWTGFAWWLTRHPTFGGTVRRLGRVALPFVLIVIGLWVLFEARSWTLLG